MLSLVPRRNNWFSLMDDFENNYFSNTVNGSNQFRCDISDKGEHFLIEADMPGFSKDDINITVNENLLTISAMRSEKNETTDKDGFIRRERRYGSFSRSFDLSGVNADNIKCSYENGVLNVTLPKAEPVKPSVRTLAIEG